MRPFKANERAERISELYKKYFGRGEFLHLELPNGSRVKLSYRHFTLPFLQKVEIAYFEKDRDVEVIKISFVEPEIVKLYNFLESDVFEENYEIVSSNLENGFFLFPVVFNRKGYLKVFVFSEREFKLLCYQANTLKLERK